MMIPYGLSSVTNLDIENTAILSIIIGFHRNNKPCFMNNKELANITGMSEEKVKSKIKNLETLGWIDKKINVKIGSRFYNRIVTFKKDLSLLDKEIENYENRYIETTIDNLEGAVYETNRVEKNNRVENAPPTPIETTPTPIENDPPTPMKIQPHIILTNRLDKLNIKEIKNSCEIEISQEQELNIISKQNDFVNQYPEVIDLLDVSLTEVFKENKYTIDEFCKSKEFELIKKEYRTLKRNLPAPKPKNRETLINWYKTLGKVQVADNLYMYPYQAIILKLVFNHKYLSKMINHYDTTYFARDNKFKEFTDHYANIVSWLKSDIEKNILKHGNNQFDRYYYYNWGVDRNEIL